MNRKTAIKWIRASFSTQKLCGIGECKKSAEYYVSRFRLKIVRVCSEHLGDVGTIMEMLN